MCKSIELLSQMKSLGAELVGQFEYLKKGTREVRAYSPRHSSQN